MNSRLQLLILAAIATGAGWLLMRMAGPPEHERLRRHVVALERDPPPRESIEVLLAAGPEVSFETLMALVREMLGKPEREWNSSPRDQLKALLKIHGEASSEGAGVFVEALDDERPEVRAWSLYAISRCCNKRHAGRAVPDGVLSAVVEAMGDEDRRVRSEACDCFVDVHPDWPAGLIDCLRHDAPLVRCTAIEHGLGSRGSEEDRAGRFPDALVPMLDDPDTRVRAAAAAALSRLHRGGERVLALLRDAIRGDDVDMRRSACAAVGDMGSVAASAVPDLLACLASDDDATRRCAAMSLADIDPGQAAESDTACAIMLTALDAGDMPAVFAAQALGKLGAAAPPAVVSALERAEQSDHLFVREEAQSALKRIRSAKE